MSGLCNKIRFSSSVYVKLPFIIIVTAIILLNTSHIKKHVFPRIKMVLTDQLLQNIQRYSFHNFILSS